MDRGNIVSLVADIVTILLGIGSLRQIIMQRKQIQALSTQVVQIKSSVGDMVNSKIDNSIGRGGDGGSSTSTRNLPPMFPEGFIPKKIATTKPDGTVEVIETQ